MRVRIVSENAKMADGIKAFFAKYEPGIELTINDDYDNLLSELTHQGFCYDRIVIFCRRILDSGRDPEDEIAKIKGLVKDLVAPKRLIFMDDGGMFSELIPGYFMNSPNVIRENKGKVEALRELVIGGKVKVNPIEIPGLTSAQSIINKSKFNAAASKHAKEIAESPEVEAMLEDNEPSVEVDEPSVEAEEPDAEVEVEEPAVEVEAEEPIASKPSKESVTKALGGVFNRAITGIGALGAQKPHDTAQTVQSQKATSQYTGEGISTDMMSKRSHVFLITGDRRSGVSGITANLGMVAAAHGLRTAIVDLDCYNRAQSIYFGSYVNEADTSKIYSLLNAVRSPSLLDKYAEHVAANLDKLGINLVADDVSDTVKLITNTGLNQLLISMRIKYDVILLDTPYSMLKDNPSIIYNADSCTMIVQPDILSCTNFLNMIDEDNFGQTDDQKLFISKMCFILNRYNSAVRGVRVNRDVNEFQTALREMSDEDLYEQISTIGCIPEIPDYAAQVEDDNKLICSEPAISDLFFGILQNLYAL